MIGIDLFSGAGGTIIEGHDYIEVDMEGAYQNLDSNFAKMAKEIVEKRLRAVGIDIPVEEYFPTNPVFVEKLEQCKKEAKEEAEKRYGQKSSDNAKKIDDYVYKTARARYFRSLSPNANIPMPAYTGFELMVHLSTGIIRNLLKPCYRMFDEKMSGINTDVDCISPQIQEKIM
jgi:hypothetical protein